VVTNGNFGVRVWRTHMHKNLVLPSSGKANYRCGPQFRGRRPLFVNTRTQVSSLCASSQLNCFQFMMALNLKD
jgi:hypothetical protein